MARSKRAGAFVVILTFVVLPLYELADIGEHWPHDGDYVSMILTVLFLVGLTLMLRRTVSIATKRAARLQATHSEHLNKMGAQSRGSSIGARHDPGLTGVAQVPRWIRLKFPNVPLASILGCGASRRFLIVRDVRI
jgi:hypothetical protein